jgi:hypothetical protein
MFHEGNAKAFPFFVFKAIAIACILAFRLSASHFLVLVPQKVTKEEDTQPSRPKGSLALLGKMGVHRNSP